MAAYKIDPSREEFAKRFHKAITSLQSAIKRYDAIVVFRHQHPDIDALGSQKGLYQWLRDNFPEKEIHFVGDHHRTFTPRIYPLPEELPLSWFKEHKFLSIVVDVGDHERIADPRYKMAGFVAKIDHHPCKKEVARASVCDLDLAAAAELSVDLLLNWKGKVISKQAAYWFYIALVGDSGRFLFSSTTPHTFSIAQALLATGIHLPTLYQTMYEKSVDSLR